MSKTYSKFVCQLLEDYFGLTVMQVAEPIVHHGPLTLPNITLKSVVPFRIVKHCLQILIQHSLVVFTPRPGSQDALYSLEKGAVLSLLFLPKYAQLVEAARGMEARNIIGTLTRTGQICLSQLLFRVIAPQVVRTEKTYSEILEVLNFTFSEFKELVKLKYVTRCNRITSPDTAEVPVFEGYESDGAFCVPNINLQVICAQLVKPDTKLTELESDDSGILWKLNLSKLNQDIRIEILEKAMEQRMRSPFAGQILKVILTQGLARNPSSNVTSPVGVPEILQALRDISVPEEELKWTEEYLTLIYRDHISLMSKFSDLNGGQYIVKVKEAFELVTTTMVEKMVESRFGPIAGRLFKIIRPMEFSEPEMLMEEAMVLGKLGRRVLYKLCEANYVTIKEMRKTYTISSSVLNKLVAYVFCVEFDKLLMSMLEDAYQTVINARARLNHERENYKRLLKKEAKIEKILFNMSKSKCCDAQMKEVKGMITQPERLILNRGHQSINKLEAAQLHANQTIFIINTYFEYKKS